MAKFALFIAFAFSVFLGQTALAQAVPLPTDIKVVEPAQGTPTDNARFSGRWDGVWGGGIGGSMPHTLIVEEVTGDKAKIIYAWGTSSTALNGTPGWARYEGTFSGSELKFELKSSALVSYKFKDGELHGTYIRGRSSYSVLKKVADQQ
jgi:hypothetical protein